MALSVLHLLRKYDPREWGGTETAVAQVMTGLDAHDVTSFAYAPRTSAEEGADTIAGHPVRHFHAFVPAWGLSDSERTRLVALGGNLMSFDLGPRLLLERSVSVIHSHALGRLGGIARLVARHKRVPFVVTIHGGYRDLPDGVRRELTAPLARSFEYGKLFGALLRSREVVTGADAVLTVNRQEAMLLREEMPEERVFHMPHGLPTELYREDRRDAARTFLGPLADARFLLSVARIDWVKNQGLLVDQHPAILDEHPDVHLFLVGPVTDVAHDAYVRDRIAALGLGHRVHLLGALPSGDPRLIGLSQLAAASVLASRTETFGLVILEAWAAGSVVVASRTSGAVDLVRPGEDGFLFEVDDGPGYVEATLRALADPKRAGAMGEEGRKRVYETYDHAAVAKRVVDLYEELRARTCAT
jgi:glycosyltransferase involved in cell wall biosynthesis